MYIQNLEIFQFGLKCVFLVLKHMMSKDFK
jgi:hypothetical protein